MISNTLREAECPGWGVKLYDISSLRMTGYDLLSHRFDMSEPRSCSLPREALFPEAGGRYKLVGTGRSLFGQRMRRLRHSTHLQRTLLCQKKSGYCMSYHVIFHPASKPSVGPVHGKGLRHPKID